MHRGSATKGIFFHEENKPEMTPSDADPLSHRRHGSQNIYAPRYCLTASAGFACVLPFGLRLQAQPRCARRYLNERAARRVRRRVVHLFTEVAPLQCIAGATSPRGFFESQRGAAGGPLARTPVRLKPCRQKERSPVSLTCRMAHTNRKENWGTTFSGAARHLPLKGKAKME